MGITSAQLFNNYAQLFSNTMQSFRELTDAAKLNKKSEHVRIKTVPQATTMAQALQSFKVDSKRMEELAILNGMSLQDRVEKGMMIKKLNKEALTNITKIARTN